MNPHEHQTRRRSPAAENLAASWDQYLDSRGPRAHGDLLKAVDSHIRSEASRILGRRHPMLEEVAQEALVGAARRISTGERPDFPLAYLRKIVHNKVADMLRRETARRNREQQHVTPEVGAADASMSAEWHDFLDTLRDIVSSDEFWTLILHYHFDYSYGEIADLLDKEANAVRQIAHRGRRKCREHLTRLEGRVPAWVMLPDAGSESGGRVAESSDGDPPGLREPRMPDPADRSRRPSAGSDSAQPNQTEPIQPEPVNLPTEPPVERAAAGAKAASTWRRRPRLRPDGRGRLFGNPTTVVPLTLAIAVPLLFQVDRALDATVARPAIRTAQLVDDPGETPPPSGPTISVTVSTAPTDGREAPSTSAPPPDSSDPPTSPSSSTSSSTSTSLTTTSAPPSTATSTTPPITTTPPTTTQRPTTTRASTASTPAPTTLPSTTAPATSTASSSTPRPTTSTSSITSTTPTSTGTTASTTPTTTSTTASTTSTTISTTTSTTVGRPTTSTASSTTTTSGRDPGGGGDPPPNQ